jgi:phosphoglycerate dehydrogenase-like enzyme
MGPPLVVDADPAAAPVVRGVAVPRLARPRPPSLPVVGDATPRIVVSTGPWLDALAEAVQAGGAEPVPVDAADLETGDADHVDGAEAVVWGDPRDAGPLGDLLDARPGIRWVQLPWAGIEPYVDVVRAHPAPTWTCGKGVYADPVAEHALGLALAGMRHLDRYARAGRWTAQAGINLIGARVTILGGGGIAEALLRLLAPFRADVTVVRTTPRPMDGATRVLPVADTDAALVGARLVVLALPLTPATRGVMDRRRLGLLAPGACLVNVARGEHVVTDDLVAALSDGTLGAAGVDVTDPEPLPDGHPLWSLPNAIVTPHTANTAAMGRPLLAARVRENVRRWVTGEPLLGLVDPARGY